MVGFKELNNNLPEYYLIPIILRFSGGQTILYDKLYILLDKYDNMDNEELYKNEKLSFEFMEKFKDIINWIHLTTYIHDDYKTNFDFYEKFQFYLNPEHILENLNNYGLNNLVFIRKFKNFLFFKYMFSYDSFYRYLHKFERNNIEFIKEFRDMFNWCGLSQEIKNFGFYNNFDFFDEFKEEIVWGNISYDLLKSCGLNNIDFFTRFKDYIKFDKYLDRWEYKTEDILIDLNNTDFFLIFYKNCYMKYISRKLPDYKLNNIKSISKLANILNWNKISSRLNDFGLLNFEFISKFSHLLKWSYVIRYDFYDSHFKKYYKFIPREYRIIYNIKQKKNV